MRIRILESEINRFRQLFRSLAYSPSLPAFLCSIANIRKSQIPTYYINSCDYSIVYSVIITPLLNYYSYHVINFLLSRAADRCGRCAWLIIARGWPKMLPRLTKSDTPKTRVSLRVEQYHAILFSTFKNFKSWIKIDLCSVIWEGFKIFLGCDRCWMILRKRGIFAKGCLIYSKKQVLMYRFFFCQPRGYLLLYCMIARESDRPSPPDSVL